MAQKHFVFPCFKTVYRNAPKFRTQHLKFTLRKLLTKKQIKDFETFVNTSATRQRFFEIRPGDAYPLLHAFVDQRFGRQKKLQAMQEDLISAEKLLTQNTLTKLSDPEEHIVLAKLPEGLALWLSRNTTCPDEGWWLVSLRDSSGTCLYMVTFAFLGAKLLIASLQGPAGETAKDTVRQLTKHLHGLRPQQLMVITMQYLATALKLNGVIGIAQDNQVKLRWRLKKRVKMNYDQFWQETGAQFSDDGYWHLPPTPTRKDLAQIESKKRSMYRKRYQMLDNITEEMHSCFKQDINLALA